MIKQKHQQLFDILLLQLNSGVWQKGERLPSIRDLAQEYNVSINVASKAVELLKNSGAVSVKVGDGIFSAYEKKGQKQEFRYSANRLFGRYASGKHLRVLVEDTLPSQLVFWNSFFEQTAARFTDIELEITYGSTETKGFDIAFGGLNFLIEHGFTPRQTVSQKEQKLFAPRLYEDQAITPENCRLKKHKNYFPYGFTKLSLLSRRPLPPPERGDSTLDYLERLAVSPESSPLNYGIFSGLRLLESEGIFFSDPETGSFLMPDAALLRRTFERTAALFRAGHLLWEHGEVRDMKDDDIAEVPFHRTRKINGDQRLCPVPPGKVFSPVMFLAAISHQTLFPEECFRTLGALLEEDQQQRAEREHIFHALNSAPATGTENLINRCNADFSTVLQYFVTWELFHFITGQCDFDPRRLEAKIRWYLEKTAL